MKYFFNEPINLRQFFNSFILLCCATVCQAQYYEWRTVSPLPTPSSLNGITYINANEAIAVGDAGVALRTYDGGLNWVKAYEKSEFDNNFLLQTGAYYEPAGDKGESQSAVYIMLNGGDQLLKEINGAPLEPAVSGFPVSGGTATTKGRELQVLDLNTVITVNSIKVYRTDDQGDNWTDITPPDLGASPQFRDVFFLDSDVGYVLSGHLGLYKTTDGGENWTHLDGFSQTQAGIVYFLDETYGWIVQNTSSSNSNVIHRTTDGGSTWTAHTYAGSYESGREIYFSSPLDGILFDQKNIMTTTDGGVNWTIQVTGSFVPLEVDYSPEADRYLLAGPGGRLAIFEQGIYTITSNSLTQGQSITDIHFIDANNGLVADYNEVRRTADGGYSWVSLGLPNVSDIEFVSASTGYMVNSQRKVSKTTNGGITWQFTADLPESDVYYSPMSAGFVDASTGWVVGNNSKVFKTTDGGSNWSEQTLPNSGLTLFDVVFLDSNTGYISGSGGNVFKTTDGGENWTNLDFEGTSNVSDMYWHDASTGWLATHRLWKTTDGGASWTAASGFSSHGTVSEIDFLDANTGYLTFQGGEVYQTIDGGDTWDVFVDQYELDVHLFDIALIDVDNIWLAGSSSLFNRVSITEETPTVLGTYLPNLSFCEGTQFTASYTADAYLSDNFPAIIELSDAFGSFGSPVEIGRLDAPQGTFGNIIGEIPEGLTPSDLYRIRISHNGLNGADNGYDLTIGTPARPTAFIESSSSNCRGADAVEYSIAAVPNVTYQWSYSGSGTLISYGTTPSIEMNFYPSATSGTLSVTLSNSCGASDPLELPIVVSPYSVGGTAAGGMTVCAGASAPELSLSGQTGEVLYWEKAVSPFTVYSELSGSASANFTPELTLNETTRFRVVVQSGSCTPTESSITTVSVLQPSVGGSISGTSSVTEGNSPGTLTLSGHTGTVQNWEKSVAPFTDYILIAHTSTNYNPGALMETTRFRAVVKNSICSTDTSSDFEVTVTDGTPPLQTNIYPANNDTGIGLYPYVVIDFNENILEGTGTIGVYRYSDDSPHRTVLMGTSSPYIQISDNQMTLLLGDNLDQETKYYVSICNTCLTDEAGNAFAGITNKNDWGFTTGEFVAPAVLSRTPDHLEEGVLVASNFTITFNENVTFETGEYISIKYASDDMVWATYTLPSPNVTFEEATVTINPSTDLPYGTDMYIDIYDGVIIDMNDNSFEGFEPGDWAFSTEVELLNQSISFPVLDTKTYGDPSFLLPELATSGLPIHYEVISGTAASVVGRTVTILSAGAATIRATQDGDATYAAATPVERILTVNKASQIITIEPINSKLTTDDPFSVNASTTASGLLLTYDVLSGPADNSGNLITLSGSSGLVVLEVSQAGNGNYLPASAQVSFNVNDLAKEDQTITFSVADQIYGQVVSLNGTASSSLAVDYEIVSGPISLSGNNLILTGAGSASVRALQSGDDTYNPADPVLVEFSISKASLTITAADKNMVFGESLPELIMSYSGFVNGEGASSITSPDISTEATATSDAGTYDITLSGGSADNYELTLVNGTLTIGKADPVLSVAGIADKTIADDPFSIDVTIDTDQTLNYSVAGPATVSTEGLVTLDGTAGEVTVTVLAAANTNYNEASESVSFSVIDNSLKTQTITIEAIADKLTTDEAFEVVASATSELEVKLTVTGPATISQDNIITLDGTAGTVTIFGNQAGNDEFGAAEEVSITFEVTEPVVSSVSRNIEINLFPNPATEWITLNGLTAEANLQLINTEGHLVMQQTVNGRDQVDVSSVARGIYILRIQENNSYTTTKILIH